MMPFSNSNKNIHLLYRLSDSCPGWRGGNMMIKGFLIPKKNSKIITYSPQYDCFHVQFGANVQSWAVHNPCT